MLLPRFTETRQEGINPTQQFAFDKITTTIARRPFYLLTDQKNVNLSIIFHFASGNSVRYSTCHRIDIFAIH